MSNVPTPSSHVATDEGIPSVQGDQALPVVSNAKEPTSLEMPNFIRGSASATPIMFSLQKEDIQQDIVPGDPAQPDLPEAVYEAQDGGPIDPSSIPLAEPSSSSLLSPQSGSNPAVDETQAALSRALAELDAARREISANVARERLMAEQIETLTHENEAKTKRLHELQQRCHGLMEDRGDLVLESMPRLEKERLCKNDCDAEKEKNELVEVVQNFFAKVSPIH